MNLRRRSGPWDLGCTDRERRVGRWRARRSARPLIQLHRYRYRRWLWQSRKVGKSSTIRRRMASRTCFIRWRAICTIINILTGMLGRSRLLRCLHLLHRMGYHRVLLRPLYGSSLPLPRVVNPNVRKLLMPPRHHPSPQRTGRQARSTRSGVQRRILPLLRVPLGMGMGLRVGR